MDQDKPFDGSECLCSGAGFCEHLNIKMDEGFFQLCHNMEPKDRLLLLRMKPPERPARRLSSFPFVTIDDLNRACQQILQKLDNTKISAVLGIPRSGVIPASIIACYLGVPLISFDETHETICLGNGARKLANPTGGAVLVVDDTCVNGIQMTKSKPYCPSDSIFVAPFCTTKGKDFVDIFGETLEAPQHFLEWNFFSNEQFLKKSLFDMDGVLCEDVPSEIENDERAYKKHIKNVPAIQHRCPRVSPCMAIVTGRLEKYRKVTEQWLKKNDIKYGQLVMYQGTKEERDNLFTATVAKYKADFFEQSAATIFVESDPKQARKIGQQAICKKVLCPLDRKVYYGKQ